jgi:hypothetical protein
MMTTTKTARLASVVTLVSASLITVAPAAHAAGSVTCTGDQTLKYAPPVDNTPTDTQVHTHVDLGGDHGACLSSVPGLFAGNQDSNSAIADFSCNQFRTGLTGTPNTSQMIWYFTHGGNDTSEFTEQTVDNVRLVSTTLFTVAGVVTDGLFEGSTYVKRVTVLNDGIDKCFTQGVQEVSGEVQVNIG